MAYGLQQSNYSVWSLWKKLSTLYCKILEELGTHCINRKLVSAYYMNVFYYYAHVCCPSNVSTDMFLGFYRLPLNAIQCV